MDAVQVSDGLLRHLLLEIGADDAAQRHPALVGLEPQLSSPQMGAFFQRGVHPVVQRRLNHRSFRFPVEVVYDATRVGHEIAGPARAAGSGVWEPGQGSRGLRTQVVVATHRPRETLTFSIVTLRRTLWRVMSAWSAKLETARQAVTILRVMPDWVSTQQKRDQQRANHGADGETDHRASEQADPSMIA